MFDYKHLSASIIKPSFLNNSFFSSDFHELYFKISKISIIKSFLNLKEFSFIQENDGIFFKKGADDKVNIGQLFKKGTDDKVNIGQLFKKGTDDKVNIGQFFKKGTDDKVNIG